MLGTILMASGLSIGRSGTRLATVEELSFSGDHQFNVRSDQHLPIYSAPHWRDADLNGRTSDAGDHAYPVVFSANSTMKVSAKFALSSGTSITGPVLIKGDGPGTLNFPATVATLVGRKLEISDVAAEQPFDSAVGFLNPLRIRWSISLDGGHSWSSAGRTRNKVYVVLNDPIATDRVYHTLAHVGCTNALGKTTGPEVIGAIWADFTDRKLRRVDRTRLTYYKLFSANTDSSKGLLRETDGQCGAFASFFIDLLGVQGITCPGNPVMLRYADLSNYGGILVKNWGFLGAGTQPVSGYDYLNLREWSTVPSGATSYDWLYAEVRDSYGEFGQGTTNPASFFRLHWVVKIDGTYYDPSYGRTFASLADLEDASIAGYWLEQLIDVDEAKINMDLDGNGNRTDLVYRPAIVIKPNPDDVQLEEVPLSSTLQGEEPPSQDTASKLLFGAFDAQNGYESQVQADEKTVTPIDLVTRSRQAVAVAKTDRLPIIFDTAYQRYPLRWRMTDQAYWVVEIREPAPLQRGFVLVRIPLGDMSIAVKERQSVGIDPLQLAFIQADLSDRRDVYFDILPRASQNCTLFLQTGRTIGVYDRKLRQGERQGSGRGWEKRNVSIRVPWSEPFHVVERDQSWFFALGSGSLWRASRGEGDNDWKIDELWNKADPILMLLTHATTGQTFAFTKGKVFEVREPLDVRPCDEVDWDNLQNEDSINRIMDGLSCLPDE